MVRVHEEIVAAGAPLSYPALTAFCRRHGIGQEPKVPSGHYDFRPGQEIQHDTSPHEALIGGKKRKVQSASAALCYSHMLFFQAYPTFQRFDCKVFLNDAFGYYGGVSEDVMIDNTHVEVRETKETVEIQLDSRSSVTHRRIAEAQQDRVTLPEHRPPRGQGIKRCDPPPEQRALLEAAPELAAYVTALRQRKLSVIALRHLLRMVREYPRTPVVAAVAEAARFGLYDMNRLERMILRRIARDYFLLDQLKGTPDDEDE